MMNVQILIIMRCVKFECLSKNVGYKFVYEELEYAVYNAIDVPDIVNWASAVKQYIEYLVERTELVQEIDENIYDFAHKTFYEYFLAFYFCKAYRDNELVELLGDWIGDSNNDELARLIIVDLYNHNMFQPKYHARYESLNMCNVILKFFVSY